MAEERGLYKLPLLSKESEYLSWNVASTRTYAEVIRTYFLFLIVQKKAQALD